MEFFKVVAPAEALEAIRGFSPLPAEVVSSLEGAGRVLAEDVGSPVDLPDFPRTTMDGYAVRASDTFGASESIPAYLDLEGEVKMGEAPTFALAPGRAARIPTGGMMPEGSDAVVMEEFTALADERTVEVKRGVAVGENVLRVGDDLRQGALILRRGTRLRPQDIGALSGVGVVEVRVHRRPRVAILPTGDELVDPREEPKPGQVRDINRFSLAAAVRECGGEPWTDEILRDELGLIQRRLREAAERSDVVLISGGSSLGVRDYAVQAINSLGEPGVLVHGISIKPGKPTIIGRVRWGDADKAVLGIPGHPVSALMIFHAFVRPILRALSGMGPEPFDAEPRARARLARNLPSAPGREDLVRVTLEGDAPPFVARPLMGSSAMISTMTRAHGYIVIPLEAEGLREGQEVEVRLF